MIVKAVLTGADRGRGIDPVLPQHGRASPPGLLGRVLLVMIALAVAAVLWLPAVHLWFRPPPYREPLRRRIDVLVQRMQAGPVLSAESYPDECWTFDQTVALAAIRVGDHLDGTDHGEFFRKWLAAAREKLVHSETGLLVSSFTHEGHPLDGPEGSTIWMASHMLQVIDPEFARAQYEAARRELRRDICGFGFAREWPAWQKVQEGRSR